MTSLNAHTEGSTTSLKSCRPSLKSSLYFGESLKSEISPSKNAGYFWIFPDTKCNIAMCFHVVLQVQAEV